MQQWLSFDFSRISVGQLSSGTWTWKAQRHATVYIQGGPVHAEDICCGAWAKIVWLLSVEFRWNTKTSSNLLHPWAHSIWTLVFPLTPALSPAQEASSGSVTWKDGPMQSKMDHKRDDALGRGNLVIDRSPPYQSCTRRHSSSKYGHFYSIVKKGFKGLVHKPMGNVRVT